jgi:hypothetical protein
MIKVTFVEWTYDGETFGVTINPADVDGIIEDLNRARRKFLTSNPSRGRDDFLGGLVRMIERNEHCKEDTGRVLGAALLWFACTSPQPIGFHALRRAKEGGSTLAYEITKGNGDWSFRLMIDTVPVALPTAMLN